MNWLTRYRIKEFFRSSYWFFPLLGVALALIFAPLTRFIDKKITFPFLNYDVEGARAILGVFAGAMLTFTLFLFTMLLLAVQIASAQLTPRVIAGVFRRSSTRLAAGIFLFTFIYCLAVLGRIREPPPQLQVFLAILFGLLSIGAFLYLVDYFAKALRPISMLTRVAEEGGQVIREVYPHFLEGPAPRIPSVQLIQERKFVPVLFGGKSGVLVDFDLEGLKNLAIRYEGVIELVPQVGDFISKEDLLFRLYDGAVQIPHKKLKSTVTLGSERTMAQDPAFAFRMIVDISIRALSPAINDPTTAVLGLDQIQQLLLQLGKRRLKDEGIYDDSGKLRMLVKTPNWEDFVCLGIREIRWYGTDSFQINRRLRAMLEDLMKRLPPERLPALEMEAKLLNRSVEKSFLEPEDRKRAEEADHQGFGGVVQRQKLGS
jgi:Predicted membrane protein